MMHSTPRVGFARTQVASWANTEVSMARAGYHRGGMLPGAMASSGEHYKGWRVAVLGAVAFLTLVPVTLPVSVLRAFVGDRFHVSELMTSLFMSINMIGAFLTAPLAGALSDRLGRRRKHRPQCS